MNLQRYENLDKRRVFFSTGVSHVDINYQNRTLVIKATHPDPSAERFLGGYNGQIIGEVANAE